MPIKGIVNLRHMVWNVVAVLDMAVKKDLFFSLKMIQDQRMAVLLNLGNLVLITAIIAHQLISKDTNIVYLILQKPLN